AEKPRSPAVFGDVFELRFRRVDRLERPPAGGAEAPLLGVVKDFDEADEAAGLLAGVEGREGAFQTKAASKSSPKAASVPLRSSRARRRRAETSAARWAA
ncbi:hypothetical protein, partial [Hydrogenibacillus schlegelii]|uniref:hypothetical protein n=1 Tax=Hydrogenibacillus schlegelii TaxID=1484 RepID=UPI0034A04E21